MTKKQIDFWAENIKFAVTLLLILFILWHSDTSTSGANSGNDEAIFMLFAFLMGTLVGGSKGKGSNR